MSANRVWNGLGLAKLDAVSLRRTMIGLYVLTVAICLVAGFSHFSDRG